MTGRHDRRGWPAWLLAATLLAVPATPFAQEGADELASMIEQSLDGIAFRVDLRPEQAANDLEAQQRRLELLEKQAPDHPALPGLQARVAELQQEVASGLADSAGDVAADTDTSNGATSPPEDVKAGLRAIRNLQDQAEAELSRGRPEEASAYVDEAEMQLARLEARHEGEIPAGHVPLIVAKERLATLKDQLADQNGPGSADPPAD